MHPILTDLSDAALGRASKANLTDFFRSLGRAPSVEFAEADGLAHWRTGLNHPWFNGVWLGRPPRPGDESMPRRYAEHFQSAGVGEITLWIDVETDRGAWHPILEAAGYRYDTGAPGMALLLDTWRAPVLPAGFTIERVNDEETLAVWCRTFSAGYGLPAEWNDPFFAMMRGLGLEFPYANWLGRLHGEPVTTSNIFYGAGVAGVQFVATVGHARRRGLGGLITLAPLGEARALGYRAAILQASDMGFSVYQGLGFRKLFDVDNYAKGKE